MAMLAGTATAIRGRRWLGPLAVIIGWLLIANPARAAVLPATITENTVLTSEGGPYTGASVMVAEGVALKVQPGTIIKLSGALTVNGRLEIDGTDFTPVVLTSIKDDSYGGDTNGDGTATIPKAGDWRGIVLNPSGEGFIKNAKIKYSGNSGTPALTYSCPCAHPLPLEHSTIERSASGGVKIISGSPVIRESTIANNAGTGINASASAPVIHDNVISHNTWDGIALSAGTNNHISVDIEDNLIEANTESGIRVTAGTGSQYVDSAAMGGNEVKDNGGKAIIYEVFAGSGGSLPADPVPTDLTTNTLSGNKKNGIWLSGTVVASQAWSSAYPIVLAGTVRVGYEATLSLAPGEVVKGDGKWSGLTVVGSIDPEGTAEVPVTFTSIKDDSIGGDTNADGSATSPAAGDWHGVEFAKTQLAELHFLSFRYAEVALDIQFLDGLYVSDSDFVHNKAAIKVLETAKMDPALIALPCVPPYTAFIWAEHDWFGPFGLPAPSIDLSNYLGAVLPEKYAALFSWALILASEVQPNYGLENTIPFSIYSCGAVGIPPIPVTPVHVAEPVFSPHFSEP
jgi:parallel beta helix pectate lyase-like protein